tara:strand:- start:1233 stop:1652 length:420 start_codon:yes stop_codon:yes gene_type:complete
MAKNGFSMSNRLAVEEITAGSTKTLTVDDCGKFFFVEQGAVATTINLPTLAAAESGWNVTVVKAVSGSSSAKIDVKADGDDGGTPMVGVELGPSCAVLSGDDLSIANVAEAGTQVTLTCIGGNWIVTGRTATDAGITIA